MAKLPWGYRVVTKGKRSLKFGLEAIEEDPVKHGQWIWNGVSYVCNQCRNEYDCRIQGMKYCPNCGARMDEGCNNEAD